MFFSVFNYFIIQILWCARAIILKNQNSKNRIFNKSTRHNRKLLEKTRIKTAYKLNNPRLLQIHFHTIRHWYATTLYQKTKNIVYVQRKLGHKNPKNTYKYIQLSEEMYGNIQEYVCEIASNPEDAVKLIEKGFEYVDAFPNGEHIYRKPKMG